MQVVGVFLHSKNKRRSKEIAMAIYHFEAKVITRGTGRSVVAATSYASCSQIYNDYDGVNHDYARKQGCVYSEVFLPLNAPTEWQDRAELWNAVEAAEKTKDSRLARELVVALPIELKLDDWKSILKDFLSEQCVSKGMCADVSIHDTDGHNPHAHILLTVRPLGDKGKWQAKTQKEYLCKCGDEDRGFTSAEFNAAQSEGWEKQYQYFVGKKKIYMPPSEAERNGYERASENPKSTRYGRQNPICAEWNSEEQILIWRKAWEDVTNQALEQHNFAERIDCRSFADRGIDEQPTIHEGITARIIEQRGGVSERCELNRQIRADNILLRKLKTLVKTLEDAVKKTIPVIAAALEGIRDKLISAQYEMKHNESLSNELMHDNIVIDIMMSNYNSVKKQIKQKSAEKKKLQSEQKSLSPLHIFKHKNMPERIEALNEDITHLRNRKAMLLDDMHCKSEDDIPRVKQRKENNNISLKNIEARNAQLAEQNEKDIAEYKKISNDIVPEDMPAVQEERSNFRSTMKSLWTKIQMQYGYRSNYDLLAAARDDVDKELGEHAPHMRKSLRKDLGKKRQQADEQSRNRRKRHEWER